MQSILLKICLSFFSLTLSLSLLAQDKFEIIHHYKPFKVDMGLGYAHPQGKGNKAGALLYLEPKVNLLDKLSVGIRTEATAMARGYINVNNTSVTGDAGLSLSFLGTADYYFINRVVRPYIGAGAGIYNLVGVVATSSDGGSVNIPAETKFGGMVRAGLEIWHFRIGLEYNMIQKSALTDNNYLGIKFGIVFGGGVKNEYNGSEY